MGIGLQIRLVNASRRTLAVWSALNIKQSEAIAKSKGGHGSRLSTMFARTWLLVIRLTLTLHLFVLLHHFLLHLLPFGLLVRC